MGTTHRELRRERAPWSERRLDMGRGKRIGNSGRSKGSDGSRDASGHSANAGRPIIYSADDPCALVEGESFDILVCSGSGEGLEAWRRLHKRWDPLTTGRERGLLREILSPGRAKLVELQGAVERLEDLMRRYTQRRDARNGQCHTLAEDIRMAALEAPLPEELERHCQLQRSRLDTYQKLREEVVLYAEARGCVAPKLGQVSKAREDNSGKDETLPKERERIPLALAKKREQEKMEKMVRNHQDERTHRKLKVSVGIAGKQVINTRTAG